MIEIELLTMAGCDNCESAKAVLEKLQRELPGLKLSIVDVAEHPEAARKHMLMAAPGIVINGRLEFSGGVREEALRRKVEELTEKK